jgi:hypothetical protein
VNFQKSNKEKNIAPYLNVVIVASLDARAALMYIDSINALLFYVFGGRRKATSAVEQANVKKV